MEEITKNEAAQPEKKGEFAQQLIDALIHLVYRFVYFLFVLPYGLWRKAVVRMSEQKKNGALNVTEIQSEFPFLSWLKRFVFDFLIDGLTVIAWLLFLIIFFVENGKGLKYMGFFEVLMSLYVIYITPTILAIFRDALVIFFIMPIRWLISLFRRPAKTYDLNHTGIK